MNKNKKTIICVSLSVIVSLIIEIHSGYLRSEAEESRISSNGNFVFENGEKEASFYAEDIDYLQKEITALLNEMEEENE